MSLLNRPMLAAKAKDNDFDLLFRQLKFPKLGSPKLDGIRALGDSGKLFSRKLKLIPNRATQAQFGRLSLHGIDGELIVGKPYAEDVYRVTDSGVMTHAGDPGAALYVFDVWDSPLPFERRLAVARDRCMDLRARGVSVVFVPHELIKNLDDLLAYEEKCVARGFEGVMLRDPLGPYKQGRSTMVEQWLIKMKRFVDFEAEILDTHELLHNANEATVNELGLTKRSSHKANKHGRGTLGGFTLRTQAGVVFRCGGGAKGFLDDATRARLWAIRTSLPGMWLKCESLPIGVKDKPRHPKVIGFRNPIDF